MQNMFLVRDLTRPKQTTTAYNDTKDILDALIGLQNLDSRQLTGVDHILSAMRFGDTFVRKNAFEISCVKAATRL